MPAAISTFHVKCALRPFLGTELLTATSIGDDVAHVLRSYAPYKENLEQLAQRVADTLFSGLYAALGPQMTLRLDGGSLKRIHMQDIPDVADAAMGVLFDGMTVYSVSFQTLKDYSLHTGSLSAMRVLYQKFDDFQSQEEKTLMAQIIRGSYPKARYAAWLPDEE